MSNATPNMQTQKPLPLAVWNATRGIWEKPQLDLFGQQEQFWETWPTSGMTRNGVAYELPTLVPPTADSGSSSLLRTPCAAEAEGGPVSPATAKANGQTLRLTGQILDLVHPGLLD